MDTYLLDDSVFTFYGCVLTEGNKVLGQTVIYSPQPTAHSPQPTAHSPQPSVDGCDGIERIISP